jgi:hypothetical protein
MKKFLRWGLGALLALVVLLVIAILARDAVLKAVAERSIEEETGLRAAIGQFTTSLGSSAFHIRNLKLYNPPEFGGALMADVPELVVDLDAARAAEGKLRFRALKLVLSELSVVRNAAGRLNVEGVEKRVRERFHWRQRRRGEKFEFEFAGIEQMHLTLRKVLYTELSPGGRTRALGLAVDNEAVTGLKTEEDLGRWAGALLFRILLQVSLGQPADAASAETSTK